MIKRSLGKAGLLLALTWIAGGAAQQPAQAQSNAGWAEQVVALVNQERAKAGLNALRIVPELTLSANRYSQYMATANFFAHEGPDGSTPASRIQAAGYSGAVVWGENIAAGQPDPQSVMTAWMNSPGHRANILFRGFTEIGIGIYSAQGTRYGIYWTQHFGARANGAGSGAGSSLPGTTTPPPSTSPSLAGISPDRGAPGTVVTLTGQRFGNSAGSVSFAGVQAQLLAWSDGQIQARVPTGASSGNVYVQAAGGTSNGRYFTVTQAATTPPPAPAPAPAPTPTVNRPTVTYTYPSTVRHGSRISIYGRGFGQTRGAVRLNGAALPIDYWYDTIISVTIPNGATTGSLVVESPGGSAAAGTLTVQNPAPTPAPTPSPSPAPAPAPAPTPSPTPTFPGGTGTGAGNPSTWTPPAPTPAPTTRPVIHSITYGNSPQGRTMTLTGTGFGTGQGRVLFGRISMTVLSWSDTRIVLLLPGSNYTRSRLGVSLPNGTNSTQVRTGF